jgi:hypothetical protein
MDGGSIHIETPTEAVADALADDPAGFLDVLDILAAMPLIQMAGFTLAVQAAVMGQRSEAAIPAFLRQMADAVEERLAVIAAEGLQP